MLLFWQRHLIARAQSTFPAVLEAEEAYQKTMRGVDRLAVEVTAVTQRGSLPLYLGAILLVVIALPGGALLVLRDWPAGVRAFDTPAQLLVGAVMVVAAVPRRHLPRPAARGDAGQRHRLRRRRCCSCCTAPPTSR